jgi:hypothetical protein
MGLKAGYEIDWARLEEKQLLRATVRGAFDKADTSLRDQLALAVVNERPTAPSSANTIAWLTA